MLALAADEVWCRAGAVLNPHYRLMGLYGSEYWTYTLPRRVGPEAAERLTREALPVERRRRAALGLVDRGPGVRARRTSRREVARTAGRPRPLRPPPDAARREKKAAPGTRRGRQRPLTRLPGRRTGADAGGLLRPGRAVPRPPVGLRTQEAPGRPRSTWWRRRPRWRARIVR